MCDTGSGDTAYDQTANDNDGTLHAGAGWATDHPNPTGGSGYDYVGNRSLTFDGDDDGVYMSSSSSLQINQYITLQAWIKADATCADNAAILSKRCSSGDFAADYTLCFNSSHLRMTLHGSDTVDITDGGTATDLTDGQWHHVAGTYDGTTAILYIDGSEVERITDNTWTLTPTSEHLRFGRARYLSYFKGNMDEISILNEALSADDVNHVYLNSGAVPEPATMVLLGLGGVGLLIRRRRRA